MSDQGQIGLNELKEMRAQGWTIQDISREIGRREKGKEKTRPKTLKENGKTKAKQNGQTDSEQSSSSKKKQKPETAGKQKSTSQQIRDLSKDGYEVAEIAKELDIAYQFAYNVVKRMKS